MPGKTLQMPLFLIPFTPPKLPEQWTPATLPAPTPPARWRRSRRPRLAACAGSSSTSTATGRLPSGCSSRQRPWDSRPWSSPPICPTRTRDATTSATASACLPTWNWRTWKEPLRFVKQVRPFIHCAGTYHMRQNHQETAALAFAVPERSFSPAGSAASWLDLLPDWVLSSESSSSCLRDTDLHSHCNYSPPETCDISGADEHVCWQVWLICSRARKDTKGPVHCCSLDEFSFCCLILAVGRWLLWVRDATQQHGSFSHLEWHLLAAEPDTPAHHHQRHPDKRRCRAGSETRGSGNYCVQSWWKATGWRTCHCKWENGCPTFSLFTVCMFALTWVSLCPVCVHSSVRLDFVQRPWMCADII